MTEAWKERANQYHAAVARGRHPTSFTRRDNALWQFVKDAEQLRKEVSVGHTLWNAAAGSNTPQRCVASTQA